MYISLKTSFNCFHLFVSTPSTLIPVFALKFLFIQVPDFLAAPKANNNKETCVKKKEKRTSSVNKRMFIINSYRLDLYSAFSIHIICTFGKKI